MSFIESREKLYQDMLDWAYEIGSIHQNDPQKAKKEASNFRNFLVRMQNSHLIFEEEAVFLKRYLKQQIADSGKMTAEERGEAHSRLPARFPDYQINALKYGINGAFCDIYYSKDGTPADIEAKATELEQFIKTLRELLFINDETLNSLNSYLEEEKDCAPKIMAKRRGVTVDELIK